MPNPVLATAADAAGRVLSTLTHGVAKLRQAEKPLHPEGVLYAGRLLRQGSDQPIGVPWLEQAGEDDVLVRLSRAVGLPNALPDFHGLALRVRKGQTRYGDLLLANTGWNPVTRHLLVPGWSAGWPMTTLLPYRSPAGPLVLGARGAGEGHYRLWWARVGHGWVPFADLFLDEPLDPDQDVSFDPVQNVLPGLQHYDWIERLRERSYAAARSERHGRSWREVLRRTR